MSVMECTIEGCNRPVKNKLRGLCHRCYQWWRINLDPEKTRCEVDDCTRPIMPVTSKRCQIHNRRAARGGGPEGVGRGNPGVARGIRNLAGRYVNKDGYVRVKVPGVVGNGGWVLEHRVVMEQRLGRGLLPGENVHHIDGNKENNHPDNLELWVSRQPAGQRPEDLIDWAVEILRRYRPDALLL